MLPQKLPWEKIKRICLLGTDRANLPEAFMELFQQIGIDLDQREDQLLLSGITKLAIPYRTARKFPKAELVRTEQALANSADLPPMEVAQMLGPILTGDYGDMLSEYLACLQIRNWSFPPEQLPDFLTECVEQPALWEKVRDHIGPTAHWMISMNKDWSRLKSAPKERNWRSKFPEDKLSYFRYIRDIDPYSANELLKEDWKDMSSELKAAFLNIIAEAPTELDFELINELKLGKGKKVALAIFKIRRQNLESELCKSALHFFQEHIEIKNKISITLPELDQAADLQLTSNHPDYSGGLKANYLAQIFSAISLASYEAIFDQSPKEIIQLFSKNEWSFSFYQAIVIRSIEEKNQAWLSAIFFHYLDTAELVPWNETKVDQIYNCLSDDSFVKLVNICAAKGPKIVDKESPFIDLMINYPKDWPNEATFALFKLIKNWMQKNPRFWEGWYIWQVIRKAAFRVDPLQLGPIQKAFQSDETWALAEDEINKFLEVLSFRYRLYKSYP